MYAPAALPTIFLAENEVAVMLEQLVDRGPFQSPTVGAAQVEFVGDALHL